MPLLKQMSVSELIDAMKIYPLYYHAYGGPQGVLLAVWAGNQEIIKEIRSRPADQLEPLKSFAKGQKFEVFLNDNDAENLALLSYDILTMNGIPCRSL